MTDLEPPLARALFEQSAEVPVTRYSPILPKRAPSPPPIVNPQTPDRPDRSTDPLSAHIFARTQSGHDVSADSPSFRRGLSDLVIGRDKASKEDLHAPVHQQDPEKKDRKKRVSFFAKLRGKDSNDDYVETTDELSRSEGANACTFRRSLTHKTELPTYIRVRSSNKDKRDFNNVFLAQELRGTTTAEELSQSIDGQKAGAIWSMTFSKDGKYLATGGQDCVVRVWRVLSSHKDRAMKVTGDSDVDSTLHAPVFCAKPYREYRGHTADVLDLSWSKNNFLLSSSMDKTVRLWHVSREECLCCYRHSDFVTSIAFHPKDDRFFLSGSLDCKLRLWNIPEKKVHCWNELPELITAVAFDPTGRMAIAGSFTGLCLFYETEGLRYHTQIHVKSSRGRNARGSKITGIQAVSVYPDNPHSEVKVLITSNDSRIRQFNLRDKSLEMKFKGNENTCSQIRATFNDDCRYVICGSEDREVYIWNAKADPGDRKDKRGYEHFEAHTNIVSATAFAPNKTRELLAASGDPIYDIVQQYSHRNMPAGSDSHAQTEPNYDYATRQSSDGNIIVCADYTGRIKVFRQDSAQTLRHKATTEDRSDNSSIMSKRLLRRTSIRSVQNNTTQSQRPNPTASPESIVSRKPHEAKIPISPARNRVSTPHTTSVSDSSSTVALPSIKLNGTDTARVFDSDVDRSVTTQSPSRKGEEHKDGKDKNVVHNPYLGEGGTSFTFYDTNSIENEVVEHSRPDMARGNSTISWKESGTAAVTCRSCGSTTFGASKVRGDVMLKCLNCGNLVS